MQRQIDGVHRMQDRREITQENKKWKEEWPGRRWAGGRNK
jgi:hypothetical protein